MRWIEFFEGENGRLSMTRLTCFSAFFPSTYLLIVSGTEMMMLYYLGAFVLGYIGGKGFEAMASAAESKAQGLQSDVVVPDAQTVNVKADGDVNVTKKNKKGGRS